MENIVRVFKGLVVENNGVFLICIDVVIFWFNNYGVKVFKLFLKIWMIVVLICIVLFNIEFIGKGIVSGDIGKWYVRYIVYCVREY